MNVRRFPQIKRGAGNLQRSECRKDGIEVSFSAISKCVQRQRGGWKSFEMRKERGERKSRMLRGRDDVLNHARKRELMNE